MQQPINEFESPVDLMQAAAIGHAMAGEWGDAISANLKLIAHDPSDLEAHNRLGKAYTSLGRSGDAVRAYRAALAISPGNPIAQRNLARLKVVDSVNIADGVGAAVEMARVTGSVDGSAIVTRLERTAGPDVLEGIAAGDKLNLEASPAGVRVSTTSGKYLGVVNGKLSVRIAKLIVRGNRYEAFAAGGGATGFPIQIVESFKHTDLAGVISFPNQYVERLEPNDELDKYDISGGAGAHEGVQGSSLIDVSDDELVEGPGSAGRSALSGDLESPAI